MGKYPLFCTTSRTIPGSFPAPRIRVLTCPWRGGVGLPFTAVLGGCDEN